MRRRRPERRSINPDQKFNDLEISKFINYLLKEGKKGIAEKIFYTSLDIVQEKTKKDPVDIFKKALNNVSKDKLNGVEIKLVYPKWSATPLYKVTITDDKKLVRTAKKSFER